MRDESEVDEADWSGVRAGETDTELAEEAAIESEVTDLDSSDLREAAAADMVCEDATAGEGVRNDQLGTQVEAVEEEDVVGERGC